MRRIVFSIAFFRKRLPVQLILASTKSRQNFYVQIQLQSFHTAWVTSGGRGPHETKSGSPIEADMREMLRFFSSVPLPDIQEPGEGHRSRRFKRRVIAKVEGRK